jgi:hypothetical protein
MHAYDTLTGKREFEDNIKSTWHRRYDLNREEKLAMALSILEYISLGGYYMDEGTTAFSVSEQVTRWQTQAQWYQLSAR